MTSSALFFVFGCLSTGIPRPSSEIVMALLVVVQRDRDVRRVAVHRLVYGVVEDLPDEVVESGRSHAADVHAGSLPNGLEPLQDGDVFRCVVGRHLTRK